MESANEFAHSWGTGIFLIQFMLLMAIIVYALYKFFSSSTLKNFYEKYPRFPKTVVSTIILMCMIGIAVMITSISPFTPHKLGRVNAVYLLAKGKNARIVIHATRTIKIGKGGGSMRTTNTTITTDMEGKIFKNIRLPSTNAFSHPVFNIKGRFGIFHSGKKLSVIDLWIGQMTMRAEALTRDMVDYKLLRTSDKSYKAIARNGTERILDLTTKDIEPVTTARIDNGYNTCHTVIRHTVDGRGVSGMLRPAWLRSGSYRPCSYPSTKGQIRLALTRDTAFGKGAYLISAINADKKVIWSTPVPNAGIKRNEVTNAFTSRNSAGKNNINLFIVKQYTLLLVTLDIRNGTIHSQRFLY